MNPVQETFWIRLQPVLATFAKDVTGRDPSLSYKLGRTSNDAFVLRGYLAFTKTRDSGEVAITVDVRRKEHQLAVASDACTGDGIIIAPGPSASISPTGDREDVQTALDGWLAAFEGFLRRNEQTVRSAAARLS